MTLRGGRQDVAQHRRSEQLSVQLELAMPCPISSGDEMIRYFDPMAYLKYWDHVHFMVLHCVMIIQGPKESRCEFCMLN